MSGIHFANGELVGESGNHHSETIGKRLQFTVPAFFTSRTKVIAFNEQQFDDGFPLFIDVFDLVFNAHILGNRRSAGRH